MAPCAAAASVGRSPAAPTIPGHDEVGGRGGGLDQSLGSRGRSRLAAGERLLECAVQGGIADDGLLRAHRAGLFCKAVHAAAGRSAPRP